MRAELWGIISAIEWAVKYGVDIILWTDSPGTWRKATGLQNHPELCNLSGDNADLWLRFVETIARPGEGQTDIRWTSSHIDVARCEDDVEEFLAAWNDIADRHALDADSHRGHQFIMLLTQAEGYYQLWQGRLQHLKAFYLKVADVRQDSPEVIDLTAEPAILAHQVADTALGDALQVNWQQLLLQAKDTLNLPIEFVLNLFHLCIMHEPDRPNFEAVSFVELALWIVQYFGAQLPTERATDGQWQCKSIFDMLLRPTVAYVTQKTNHGLIRGLQTLGLDRYIVIFAGVFPGKLLALLFLLTVCCFRYPKIVASICHTSAEFFGPKLLRKAADLAKPFAQGQNRLLLHWVSCAQPPHNDPRYTANQDLIGGLNSTHLKNGSHSHFCG